MRRLDDMERGNVAGARPSVMVATRPRRFSPWLLVCVVVIAMYVWIDSALLDDAFIAPRAKTNTVSLAEKVAVQPISQAPAQPTTETVGPSETLRSQTNPGPTTKAVTKSVPSARQATAEPATETVADSDPSLPTGKQIEAKRFAYMFYVTKDIYGCAALHLMHNLVQTVRMDTSRIDLVVLHSRGVSQHMLDNIQAAVPVRFIQVDSIRADTSDPTWVESLTKLNAFRDWGYDRVVYMDADGVPLKNLDHLFDLPPNVLYSPTAYWLKQPFFTSSILVIEPSEELFEKMIQWARERGAAAGYDMDILNSYFADTVIMLPGDYTVLNSDFRAKPDAPNKLYPSTTLLKANTQFVHFSCRPDGAYGKPWTAQSHDLSVYKQKGFEPLFAELYEAFWRTQEDKCA